jgi:transposase
MWFHEGMQPLRIADSDRIVLGSQDEIRRTEESRYDHRLHGVLLVAQGITCSEVSRLLGDGPRVVQYGVRRFEERGLVGLVERERSGRSKRLSESQGQEVNGVLRRTPCEVGLSGTLWDGKTLSAWIERRYGVRLGVRQCQRLFRQGASDCANPAP